MGQELLRLAHTIGLDEAGRGPLAGPVTAAAVWIPDSFAVTGINDSKKLTPESRNRLAERIKNECKFAVAFVDPEEIDRLNILWASMKAMTLATRALIEAHPELTNAHAVVDGNRVPSDLPVTGEWVIKGDAKVACIAAASIIAKSARDAYMQEVASKFPGYGFETHFGYPTPAHFEAIQKFGPCALHRLSFRPFSDHQLAFQL